MCGIAGSYQQADGQKLVDIMTDRIAHRGPDATGTWSHQDDRVAVHLGHLRLSIIDLSAAVRNDLQPVINDVLMEGGLTRSGMIRADALRRLIQDEQAGREDRAKQIWQLLRLEFWYHNVRSAGVAA